MKLATLLLILMLTLIGAFTTLNWGFTELRKYMETEMAQQTALHATSKSVLTEKMGQMETNVRAAVEQSGNTLASYIGELEDRLERKKAAPPSF